MLGVVDLFRTECIPLSGWEYTYIYNVWYAISNSRLASCILYLAYFPHHTNTLGVSVRMEKWMKLQCAHKFGFWHIQ